MTNSSLIIVCISAGIIFFAIGYIVADWFFFTKIPKYREKRFIKKWHKLHPGEECDFKFTPINYPESIYAKFTSHDR